MSKDAPARGKPAKAWAGWRERAYFREAAQLSLAWLGLALLSAQTGPWSAGDLILLAALLGVGVWRR